MPTARELLEQADALMRRNRAREEPPPALPPIAEEEIPELAEEPSEVVPAAVAATPAEPMPRREALARELLGPPSASYPLPASPTVIATLDDIPELTDIVEEIEAPSMLDVAGDFDLGEPSVFMESGHGEVSILGPWPEPPPVETAWRAEAFGESAAADAEVRAIDAVEIGIMHVSPELLDDDAVDGLPVDAQTDFRTPVWVDDGVAAEPPLPSASNAAEFSEPGTALAEPSAEAGGAADARWGQIAEEIRMQVLQRIDIFTDTGLQEQLAMRLQPIVDRASADLVSTINQQVGQLLRAYVAEAIEREIEQWRADNRP
jgi:hypothetical protein